MKAPDMIGACTKEGVPLNPAAAAPEPGDDELGIVDEGIIRGVVGSVPGWNQTRCPTAS